MKVIGLLPLALSLAFASQSESVADKGKGCKGVDWPSWGRDKENTRNNPESLIETCSVKDLRLSWIRNLGGNIYGQPALENGFLYVTDESGGVWKLNEKDGSTVWYQNIKQLIPCSTVPGVFWTSGFSRNTPIVLEDRIVLGLRGPAWLLAFDKNNGGLLWRTVLDDHPSSILTQSGSHENGVIYQGVSSLEEGDAANPDYPCCSFVGSMNAIDAATGRIIWSTPMIPDALGGFGKFTGCSVWGSSPPIDEKAVYIGTGNIYKLPPLVEECVALCEANPQSCVGKPPCVPESVHYDSVLALDKKTGQIIWSTRLEVVDAWNVGCILPGKPNCDFDNGPDFDFGQAPIIFGKDGLVIGQKSGVVWGINRRTGKVRWSNKSGPGGTLGGITWGSSLITNKRGCPRYTLVGQNANSAAVSFTLMDGTTTTGGVLFAIDAETGNTLWQTKQPLGFQSNGPVSTTSNVIFAPRYTEGSIVAYSAIDGHELWSYRTNATTLNGATIGRDSVYFGNGYARTFNGTPGGNLYAFKLK